MTYIHWHVPFLFSVYSSLGYSSILLQHCVHFTVETEHRFHLSVLGFNPFDTIKSEKWITMISVFCNLWCTAVLFCIVMCAEFLLKDFLWIILPHIFRRMLNRFERVQVTYTVSVFSSPAHTQIVCSVSYIQLSAIWRTEIVFPEL